MADLSSSGGVTIVGVLGVVFVTLKLCKVIDWSWWWVTLPFWGGIALVLAILVTAFALLGIVKAFRWAWSGETGHGQ